MNFAMLEKMGEFFDARLHGYEEHQLTCIKSAAEFYPFTARQLPMWAGSKVLDLGCGTGLELNEYFKFEYGMIITKDDTELIVYLQTNNETDFIFLSDELITIHEYAFYGHNNLEMVVIPSNVKVIGKYAFADNNNIEKIPKYTLQI